MGERDLAIAIYLGNCSSVDFDEPARQRIAAAVRARRARLGLSQEQASRASGGMISTANLRVVEGAGRSSFRPKSLIGVARALSWPVDAVEQIAAGVDPSSLPTVLDDTDGTTDSAPTPSPVSVASTAAPSAVPSAGGLELVTSAQLDSLREQVADQRAAIAELGRRVEELIALVGADPRDRSPDLLVAAHSGDLADLEPDGPRSAGRPRVGTADDAGA